MTAVEVTCLSYSHVIHSYFHSFIRSWNRFSKPCTARPELALTEYSFITSNHLDFCVTQRFCTYLKSCQRIVRMTVYRSRKTNASANPFRQHGVNIGTPYNFVGLKSGGCGKIVYLKNLVCLVRNISETADYRLFLWFENEVSQWVSEWVRESTSPSGSKAVSQSCESTKPASAPHSTICIHIHTL